MTVMATVAALAGLSQSLIATLTHGTTVSTYEGSAALQEALEAAVDGDVIVLSPGTFSCPNLTKAVSLRGAGCSSLSLPDATISSLDATYITGTVNVNIASASETAQLSIEGCHFSGTLTIQNAPRTEIDKCRIVALGGIAATVPEVSFLHCWLNSTAKILNENITMINCNWNYRYFNNSIKASNCVFNISTNTSDIYSGSVTTKTGEVRNSIFLISNNGSEYQTQSHILNNCVAYNCVGVVYSTAFFNNSPNNTNTRLNSSTYIFEGDKNAWPYVLKDTYATKYLGQDGTQVGIHGGSLPFDPFPFNLMVSKCNIAGKTTADGKLSVEIEVSTAK